MEFFTRFRQPDLPGIKFSQPSMADQSQKDDCDVNRIMARYQETGFLTDPLHPGTAKPMFGDFTNIPDYQACLDRINKADEEFSQLPSSIRDRFENNPQKLFDFLNDESNYEEAVQLGLCQARPPSAKPVDKNDEKPVDKNDE